MAIYADKLVLFLNAECVQNLDLTEGGLREVYWSTLWILSCVNRALLNNNNNRKGSEISPKKIKGSKIGKQNFKGSEKNWPSRKVCSGRLYPIKKVRPLNNHLRLYMCNLQELSLILISLSEISHLGLINEGRCVGTGTPSGRYRSVEHQCIIGLEHTQR